MDSPFADPVLLQEFLTESEELLQRMDQDLVELECAPQNPELLNRVFRALHTIKGTSGFFRLDVVAQLGHRAEDVLSSLRRGQIPLTRRVMDSLLAARDQLGKMLADIRSGGLKTYALESLLKELEEVQTEPNGSGTTNRADAALIAHAVLGQCDSGQQILAKEPDPLSEPFESAEDKTAVLRVPVQHSMRVDVRKLDELVDLVGELVLERNRLLQLARDISAGRCHDRGSDSPLSHSAARISFITDELQAAGLRTRMVPIETVFAKFPRLVRDIAHSLQKEVELVIEGAETEIDKTMVELISDPLVHLVRNSLDHGVELPEVRERAGKPRQGKIHLGARQDGDHILIVIADDGAGMDPACIRRKAVEKHVISADAAASLTTKETLNLIFLPGFSTVEKPTDLSGRGVGMDVVCSNLKKINGTVELDSEPRLGTKVLLRLPLTLAILPVLLVQVGDEVYALPLRSIVETARFLSADVHKIQGKEAVSLRNDTLPLIRLQSLFAIEGKDVHCAEQKVVVMAVGETRVALLVDRLVGQESTVVKPLASYVNQCPGLAGATVDGNGRVRLVLDPAGVLAAAATRTLQELVQ